MVQMTGNVELEDDRENDFVDDDVSETNESVLTSWCYDNSIRSGTRTEYENTITDDGCDVEELNGLRDDNMECQCIELDLVDIEPDTNSQGVNNNVGFITTLVDDGVYVNAGTKS